MDPLTEKAKELIFEYEGIDQPGDWPGGDSGITLGYGYDLGYESADGFTTDWKAILVPDDFDALTKVVGLKGAAAEAKAPALKKIKIKADAAQSVFLERSVPKYQAQTQKAFPGVDDLPGDVQGALFSLVYNRGTSMKDNDATIQERLEMRLVRDAVAGGDVAEIAAASQHVPPLGLARG